MNKQLDCVDMKRKAQIKIYEDIKDMNPEEEIQYFRNKVINGPFGSLWQNIAHQKNKTKQTVS